MNHLDPPLQGIAIFNPAFQSREETLRFFIARQAHLERLLDALRRETSGQPQHHLVVGARGMGKTTLIRRLRFAIADDPVLGDQWLGLTFPEEQYNVATLSDFWLNCVDALADTLESAGHPLPDLDTQVALIQRIVSEEERSRQALDLLCRASDHLGRRLVLLVDNVDLILDRFKDQDWALREVLSSEPRLVLVGATAAPLEAHYTYQAAFYDFFQVHTLKGLERDEVFTVLRTLAAATHHPQVARVLDEQPARIDAVRVFAGGNPRTLILLFNLLAQETEGSVRSYLERLLDLCTPLYKHRVEALAPQAQIVLNALALHYDPATAHQIAEATRLPVNTVSTQLDRLVKEGTVEKVNLHDERRIGFQVAERFFNIWYLMRTSRRVRTRLLWLVEFLRVMYEPAERRQRAQRYLTDHERDPQRRAETSLAYASLVDDLPLRHALETQSIQALVGHPETRKRLAELFDFEGEDAPLKSRAERMRLMAEAKEAVFAKNVDLPDWDPATFWDLLGGSLSVSVEEKHRIGMAPLRPTQVKELVHIFHDELGKWLDRFHPDEVTAVRRAVREGSLDPEPGPTLEDLEASSLLYAPCIVPWGIAWLKGKGREVDLGRWTETLGHSRSLFTRLSWAEQAVQSGVPRERIASRLAEVDIALSWRATDLNRLGNLLQYRLARYEEAEAAYREAITRDPNFAHPWNGLGNLLKDHLARYEEAEAAYREAIARDPTLASVWNNLGNLLKNRLGRYEEAEVAYREAITRDPAYAYSWNGLGNLLQYHLGRYEEAEAAYRESITRDPKFAHPWNGLGNLLQDHLARYEEAEAAYREAITRDPKFAHPWNGLGNLFNYKAGRPEEAAAAYREAITRNPDWAVPWYGLGVVLHWDLGRYEEAEAAYREAIARKPNLAHPWNGLGNLLKNHLGRYEEAEAAYREAITLDPASGLFKNSLAWHLYSNSGDLAEAGALAQAAVEAAPDAHFAHTLACIEVATGVWNEGPVRTFLRAGEAYLEETWPDVLRFFAEVVRHGFIPQARQVLREECLADRYEPLDLALAAAAAGTTAGLSRLAPEVRQAVMLVLERIAPGLLDSTVVPRGASRRR